MKSVLFFAFISLVCLALANAVDPCYCFANETISSNAAGVTIGAPTTTGTFSGTACGPINCNTITTYVGNLSNGLPAGALITFSRCSGLSNVNTLTVNGRTFTNCQQSYTFPITDTNVITFSFQLTTPLDMFITLGPTLQLPTTTAAPPSSTTSPYNGPFPFNPAISTMDLVIGLDINKANEQYYSQSSQMIKDIVSYFTYSNDSVRLSFITFDPAAQSGTGKYPLWSHNVATINDYLANMTSFAGNNSNYYTALQNFFFNLIIIPGSYFDLRPNIQRVFLIITGTDSTIPTQSQISNVQSNINNNDIKFVFVNMNTGVITSTQTAINNNYPQLSKITGDDSNAQHWFDYQLNEDNSVNLLKTLYFDGNTLCNLKNENPNPIGDGRKATYSIPKNPTKYYCNYLTNIQTYTNINPEKYVQVYFSKVDLSNEKDFIRIVVDGQEVSVLTGTYASAAFCLNGTTITVTFQSNNGAVYTGYQNTIAVFDTLANCKQNVPIGTKFIEILK